MTEIEDPAEAVDDERLEAELEERNEERRGEVRGDPVLRKAYAYSKERDRGGGMERLEMLQKKPRMMPITIGFRMV